MSNQQCLHIAVASSLGSTTCCNNISSLSLEEIVNISGKSQFQANSRYSVHAHHDLFAITVTIMGKVSLYTILSLGTSVDASKID